MAGRARVVQGKRGDPGSFRESRWAGMKLLVQLWSNCSLLLQGEAGAPGPKVQMKPGAAVLPEWDGPGQGCGLGARRPGESTPRR